MLIKLFIISYSYRLYHCARLVHCDLSEYNIMICPAWQVSHGHMTTPDQRTDDDETLQVVIIDFGMAVDIKHPSSIDWLKRDLSTVRDFFQRQGIKTLSNEDAEQYVIEETDERTARSETEETKDNTLEDTHDTSLRSELNWDEKKEYDVLLKNLEDIN